MLTIVWFQAARGILVLGEGATISNSLRDQIQQEGKVDIVQVGQDRKQTVREVTQYFGKMIDPNFVPDDNRWRTYADHVRSNERLAQHRSNPHGDRPTYTTDGMLYRFEHPRKQDDTIDKRYAANRDRNLNGDPDMRMAHNKTQRAQHEHLNENGSEDMRTAEHRERLVDELGHRLNTNGTLDMRCSENQPGTFMIPLCDVRRASLAAVSSSTLVCECTENKRGRG